jgi:hypothetical protein
MAPRRPSQLHRLLAALAAVAAALALPAAANAQQLPSGQEYIVASTHAPAAETNFEVTLGKIPAIYIGNIDHNVNAETFCAGALHLPKLKPQKLKKSGRFSYSVSGTVAHLPKVTFKLSGVVTAKKIVGSYTYNVASTCSTGTVKFTAIQSGPPS